MVLVNNMATIGNRNNFDQRIYEENIYREQLKISWGKHLDEISFKYDDGSSDDSKDVNTPLIPKKCRTVKQ